MLWLLKNWMKLWYYASVQVLSQIIQKRFFIDLMNNFTWKFYIAEIYHPKFFVLFVQRFGVKLLCIDYTN